MNRFIACMERCCLTAAMTYLILSKSVMLFPSPRFKIQHFYLSHAQLNKPINLVSCLDSEIKIIK